MKATSECGKIRISTIVGSQSTVLKRPASGPVSAIVGATNLGAPIRAERGTLLHVGRYGTGAANGILGCIAIGIVNWARFFGLRVTPLTANLAEFGRWKRQHRSSPRQSRTSTTPPGWIDPGRTAKVSGDRRSRQLAGSIIWGSWHRVIGACESVREYMHTT